MAIAPYHFLNNCVIIVITFFCKVKLEVKRLVGTYYAVKANVSHSKTVERDRAKLGVFCNTFPGS